MTIHLWSKEHLYVLKRPLGSDERIPERIKWNKASYEAVNIITSHICPQVFIEVIKPKNIKNSHLLCSKINKEYASRRAVNRGQVWMDWID
ncbi:hypothetical protein O181_001257 [Austropuccinia psidii MF-1]|uniref:Uncharacterized protein n=1 Tax=Austropuccinia psidii MF-1 TaxID=1389203 RepID=A0A9Q3BA88_9BASI|nr:hypothetical protein [Austropuccinia psidii MF-1]